MQMIQNPDLRRVIRRMTVSPAERILITVFLWAAVVCLAAIVIAYLLTAHP
jgi:hypothetical protein